MGDGLITKILLPMMAMGLFAGLVLSMMSQVGVSHPRLDANLDQINKSTYELDSTINETVVAFTSKGVSDLDRGIALARAGVKFLGFLPTLVPFYTSIANMTDMVFPGAAKILFYILSFLGLYYFGKGYDALRGTSRLT